jgi:hypothetical protein
MRKFGFYEDGILVGTCKARNISEANQIAESRQSCNGVTVFPVIDADRMAGKTLDFSNFTFEIVHDAHNIF